MRKHFIYVCFLVYIVQKLVPAYAQVISAHLSDIGPVEITQPWQIMHSNVHRRLQHVQADALAKLCRVECCFMKSPLRQK